MRPTTKRILSELQRLDRGETITLPLDPAIYPSAVVEKVRHSLDITSKSSAPGHHTWEVPARELGKALDALLILAVRNLN
jgi:hypothetical protein